MDRALVLFLGGVVLLISLLIPASVLEDSDPGVVVRKSRSATKGQCVYVFV